MTMDIIFSEQKKLGVITLNRVSALNALTFEMVCALKHKLETWADAEHIQAVVIQAAPGKAFCAGGDVRGLYEKGLHRHAEQMQFFAEEYHLNYLIHTYPKPYVALMDGLTMGGGVGISLHGSHPVASERFSFAMPETAIGFFPDIGASYLLARCPGYWGHYLGLTGQRINSAEAKALKLVKYTVPSASFAEIIPSLLATDLSSDAHEKVNRCLEKWSVSLPAETISSLQSEIDNCFNNSNIVEIINYLNSVDETWHQETKRALLPKSPLSLSVTLKQLIKARQQSLAACLKTDYCLAEHFMRGHDFYEGIRALLIDKDKNPHWKPEDLSEVTGEQVEAYFTSEHQALSLVK